MREDPEYLKLYFSKPENKWESYDECYEYHLKEITEYHNSYGKDGFLSERTTEEELPMRAKKRADYEWKMRDAINCNKARIRKSREKEMMKEIENSKGFIKWYEDGDIKIKYPN